MGQNLGASRGPYSGVSAGTLRVVNGGGLWLVGLCFWRPQADSNPRYRRERARGRQISIRIRDVLRHSWRYQPFRVTRALPGSRLASPAPPWNPLARSPGESGAHGQVAGLRRYSLHFRSPAKPLHSGPSPTDGGRVKPFRLRSPPSRSVCCGSAFLKKIGGNSKPQACRTVAVLQDDSSVRTV